MPIPKFLRRTPPVAERLYLIDAERAKFAGEAAIRAKDVSVEIVAEHRHSEGLDAEPGRIIRAAEAWAKQESSQPDRLGIHDPVTRLELDKLRATVGIISDRDVMLRFQDRAGRGFVDLTRFHNMVEELRGPSGARRFSAPPHFRSMRERGFGSGTE